MFYVVVLDLQNQKLLKKENRNKFAHIFNKLFLNTLVFFYFLIIFYAQFATKWVCGKNKKIFERKLYC